jgi:predicted transcriptional regulator
MTNTQKVRVAADIDGELHRSLVQLAAASQVPVAVVVRWALRDYAEKHLTLEKVKTDADQA